MKSGHYILRHEIIALRTGGNLDSAQNHLQYMNLNSTGFCIVLPAGVEGAALYKPTHAGTHVDNYHDQSMAATEYLIP